MVEPVIQAVVNQDVFALVEVARVEWRRFESQSMVAVYEEFQKHSKPDYVHLHLDHIPVVDEDGQLVDYLAIIREAIELGFDSVMVDGSRLELGENIQATRKVTELAHRAGIPCEAELGAVLGHENGPLPPYEEIFRAARGFTNPHDAKRFVRDSGCDWLSVAIGNIHGRISEVLKNKEKAAARLNLEHLKEINKEAKIPLVLHGGSGIQQSYVLEAMLNGIAKMNIGTDLRRVYEATMRETGKSLKAQEAVYERTSWLIRDYLCLSGSRIRLLQTT